MERPNPETVAYYEAAVPPDPRARKGAMFGHPCAFVNGNMFFGTFGQSVVARIGIDRTAELAKGKLRIFEPMPGRAWKEYLQVDAGGLPAAKLKTLATEALEWTAKNIAPKKTAGKATPQKPAAKKPKPAAKKKAVKR